MAYARHRLELGPVGGKETGRARWIVEPIYRISVFGRLFSPSRRRLFTYLSPRDPPLTIAD